MCGGNKNHGKLMHRGNFMAGSHSVCCCSGRKFVSKNEEIKMLEEYRDSLKAELEGVEEALQALKSD